MSSVFKLKTMGIWIFHNVPIFTEIDKDEIVLLHY
jgi:hypothetical protein